MLDRYVYGSVERMSPETSVPVLRRCSDRALAGGAGTVARSSNTHLNSPGSFLQYTTRWEIESNDS
jgi:bifunctional ADP-heptose synthase (sugar kinase/adenylyltransferase)